MLWDTVSSPYCVFPVCLLSLTFSLCPSLGLWRFFTLWPGLILRMELLTRVCSWTPVPLWQHVITMPLKKLKTKGTVETFSDLNFSTKRHPVMHQGSFNRNEGVYVIDGFGMLRSVSFHAALGIQWRISPPRTEPPNRLINEIYWSSNSLQLLADSTGSVVCFNHHINVTLEGQCLSLTVRDGDHITILWII